MNSSKKTYIIIIIILFVIYVLLFFSNLNDYFIADELDFFEMQEKSPFYFLYQGFNKKYYRPLALAFLHGMYYLFYFNPIPYHLISIILHVSNSILIYHISRRFFKKESTSIIVLFITVIFVALYFEAIIWIASYFELLFVLSCLISIEFFLKYIDSEKKEIKYFIFSNIFVTVGYLFKESTFFLFLGYLLYEIVQYDFFDLDNLWNNLKDLVRKNLIYLTYIPLIILLFLGRFVINAQLESTISQFFEPQTLLLLIGGAGAAIVLYWIFVKKLNDNNLKLILIFTISYTFLCFFHIKSRIFYLPCLIGAISLGYIFEYFDFNLFSWINEFKSIKKKKNILSIFLIIGIIFTSGFFIIYQKNVYKFLSTSTYNICRTLDLVPNGDQKNIYILNLNYLGGYYFGLVDVFFEAELYLRHKKDYNITIAYINVGDTSLYSLNNRAIPLSIDEYNLLANTTINPNNVCFLFLSQSMTLKNITNLNYSQW
ncbi:MAG: hypothetical protein EAX96_07620 [Candidatus Lokiarchaeota archaeon]|nr:hypothetical protein [Candidatus Lokiarchaeota archaeon]